ncbi:MAG: helix-turn-helix transcriptional regulator [Streptosporangiaceae bacterium]
MSPVFGHGRLRLYLLKLLDESPRHGYEVIRLLEDRFMGVYAPSAGTIYPRLARLEEEGLVTHDAEGSRKIYRLTDAGRAELERRGDELDELEQEIAGSLRDLADEVKEDVRDSVRTLREELKQAADDIRDQARKEGGQAWGEYHRAFEESRRAWQETHQAWQETQRAWRGANWSSRRAQRELERTLQRFSHDARHAVRGEWIDDQTVREVRLLLDETLHRLRIEILSAARQRRGSPAPGQGRSDPWGASTDTPDAPSRPEPPEPPTPPQRPEG